MSTSEAGSPPGPASGTPKLTDDGEIWLVRHGETEWSASGKHTSSTDLPLTERGRAAARGLAERLAGREFALVLASPRARARDTAALAGYEPEVEPDLAEVEYGEYEGRTTKEIR